MYSAKSKKIENMIAGWLKPLPHLPIKGQKWLATNIWWIALVGVILSIIGIFGLIASISTAMSFLGAYATFYTSSVYSGWWMSATIISVVSMVVITIITAMAIKPLKVLNKRGWDLLFLTFLISIITMIISMILNFSAFISSLFMTVISFGIGAYFLFEIRSYFKGNGIADSIDKK